MNSAIQLPLGRRHSWCFWAAAGSPGCEATRCLPGETHGGERGRRVFSGPVVRLEAVKAQPSLLDPDTATADVYRWVLL